MAEDSRSRRSAPEHSDHIRAGKGDPTPETKTSMSGEEAEQVEKRQSLRAVVLHEVIRMEGEGELARSFGALWWSGLAAGFSMGLSVVGPAMLAHHLPDAEWSQIIARLGYSVGFIVVIMARQQLFTEITLTAVLPVIVRMRMNWLLIMLRLWGIVLAANLVGCFLFAAAIGHMQLLPEGVESFVAKSASEMIANPTQAIFVKGIAAGWLVALLVWMLPAAMNTEFFVIGLITYIIALGELSHVIVGSIEAFYLWIEQMASASDVLGFLLPTLAGNIIGGTLLFALISYAQVREEIGQ